MADRNGQPGGDEDRRRRRHLTRGVILVGVIGLVWMVVGLNGGAYQSKLANVEKNDNTAFLPASSEATQVNSEAERFQSVQVVPGFVVFQRPGGLTPADRAAIQAEPAAFRRISGVASDQVGSPRWSTDGTTAAIAVPLVAQVGSTSVQGQTLVKVEKRVLEVARVRAPHGLSVHGAGPAALLSALIDSFSGLDGALLIAAVLVVVLILLIVYRSPVLWVFPLVSAVVALGSATLIVYTLAEHGVLTLNGQSSGILSVLVLGAGTDYALLLTARYREELHNYESRIEAMKMAWRRAATAIAASGATVIIAMLTLTLGELNSDRSLGPVCAIGIACTMVAMLTFLPLALTVMPRGVFWPRVPRYGDGSTRRDVTFWDRVAGWVGRRDRRAWVGATVVLLICTIGLTTLRAGGLPTSSGFTNRPDAVVGQGIYDAHFGQGSGAPAQITANVSAIPAVIETVSKVPGVATAPGSVCVAPDYAKLAALSKNRPSVASDESGTSDRSNSGCTPPGLSVSPEDGRLLVNANLIYNYDSDAAYRTVQRIRDAVHAIPGARALVGGQAAVNYDTNQAARHDRNLIIPIILVVILVILMALLRAILIPVLLIASVVLSFAATMGVSALFFNHVFHYAGADPSFPLFVFVFLVALGVDYNIFLMTRVREETLVMGTRPGVLRGLAVTGGVITSAGVVLAATFAVLTVIPLVQLAELGFAVALGVLLDTMIVRSILVPALSHDIGEKIWWPSRLAKASQ